MKYHNQDALVEPDWLAARLDDPRYAILDATWFLPPTDRDARAEFDAAHIPGAVHFDIDRVADPDSPLPHMLPDGDRFDAEVGALGIGTDSHVVVYDGHGAFTAPRVWWMFRAMGHDKVSILNGGLPGWRAAGLPVTDAATEVRPAHHRARPNPALCVDLETILKNLETKDFMVLDARSPGRFHGREPELRPGLRSGHMPDARNLHYEQLYARPGGVFKDAEGLAAAFASAGVAPDDKVVTTCGSGVTACILALGLHLLGRDDWAVYDGSWSEWGGRSDTPIEQ